MQNSKIDSFHFNPNRYFEGLKRDYDTFETEKLKINTALDEIAATLIGKQLDSFGQAAAENMKIILEHKLNKIRIAQEEIAAAMKRM